MENNDDEKNGKVSVQNQYVSGTCQKMCPASEMKMRERHGLLHKFEMISGTEHYKVPRVNRKRVVKEYRRPAAGKDDPIPSDLRPSFVLLKTTYYLLDEICSEGNLQNFEAMVYEYVFDRLRAVRQDMVIQHLHSTSIIKVLECCVRFHVYFQYKLCEAPPRDFDFKINNTHIQECLKRLLCLYTDENVCSCNLEEFLALYLLFNLGQNDALQLALEHKMRSGNKIKNEDFCLAISISLAWLNFNYVRVFKLADRLSSPLHLCAIHVHLATIYRSTFKIMSHGYNSKNLSHSISELSDLICKEDRLQCKELCQVFGLDITASESVVFNKSLFKDLLPPPKKCKWIDGKLKGLQVANLLKGNHCNCS